MTLTASFSVSCSAPVTDSSPVRIQSMIIGEERNDDSLSSVRSANQVLLVERESTLLGLKQ